LDGLVYCCLSLYGGVGWVFGLEIAMWFVVLLVVMILWYNRGCFGCFVFGLDWFWGFM